MGKHGGSIDPTNNTTCNVCGTRFQTALGKAVHKCTGKTKPEKIRKR